MISGAISSTSSTPRKAGMSRRPRLSGAYPSSTASAVKTALTSAGTIGGLTPPGALRDYGCL